MTSMKNHTNFCKNYNKGDQAKISENNAKNCDGITTLHRKIILNKNKNNMFENAINKK